MSTDDSIDPAARIGSVHLTIANLDQSIRFYQECLGFALHDRSGDTATLGARRSGLLMLTESPSATTVRGTTGLYHFAILVPSRRHLAGSFRRLVATHTTLQGVADHGVSESLYLADPDGNGIEIYRDRPRDEWPYVDGRLRMGVDPLDLDGLLGDADESASHSDLASETVIGHVHLRVSNIPEAERFYAGILGFDVMQRYGPGALFVAAGGYHHHIGLNTWAGVGAPSPPPGAIGLRHFVVRVSGDAALAAVSARLERGGVEFEYHDGGLLVRDPSQNTVFVAPTT